MQIELGKQIKALRRRDGRTQEDLANALNVTAQAVSRWEKGICYPDMALMPSMANYFGVSIDELFGYNNEREKKVEALVNKITDMNRQNNGEDVNIEECISLARDALVEFPGNEKIMLCLATVLYNAGYARYGERHYDDAEGYDVYDVKAHKTYAEWKEAIKLYEKLINSLEDDQLRHKAVSELAQLYLNTGEYQKAVSLAQKVPDIYGCREFLMFKSCDGRKKVELYGETLLKMTAITAEMMVDTASMMSSRIDPESMVEYIKNAIGLFDAVCTDGEYGLYRFTVALIYLYLSTHQWRCGDKDGAFESLERARVQTERYSEFSEDGEMEYTLPLLEGVKINPAEVKCNVPSALPDIWPWICIPDYSDVQKEMSMDPRWDRWVLKCKKAL